MTIIASPGLERRLKSEGTGEVLFDRFTRTRAIRRAIIDLGQDTAAPNFGRLPFQLYVAPPRKKSARKKAAARKKKSPVKAKKAAAAKPKRKNSKPARGKAGRTRRK